MNRGDIKLVIDQLGRIPVDAQDYITICKAVTMLETLDNKVAELERNLLTSYGESEELSLRVVEQAAVIEKLQAGLLKMTTNSFPTVQAVFSLAHELIAIPTDSKQVLADWMREQLGEPIATVVEKNSSMFSDKLDEDLMVGMQLFKKPECLK